MAYIIRFYKLLRLTTSILKRCNFGYGSRKISLSMKNLYKNIINIYDWVWVESNFLKFDVTYY